MLWSQRTYIIIALQCDDSPYLLLPMLRTLLERYECHVNDKNHNINYVKIKPHKLFVYDTFAPETVAFKSMFETITLGCYTFPSNFDEFTMKFHLF